MQHECALRTLVNAAAGATVATPGHLQNGAKRRFAALDCRATAIRVAQRSVKDVTRAINPCSCIQLWFVANFSFKAQQWPSLAQQAAQPQLLLGGHL
jgi:hypothetical protein